MEGSLLQECSIEETLRWCYAADSWDRFKERVTTSATRVDMAFLSTASVVTSNLHEVIDWRYTRCFNWPVSFNFIII